MLKRPDAVENKDLSIFSAKMECGEKELVVETFDTDNGKYLYMIIDQPKVNCTVGLLNRKNTKNLVNSLNAWLEKTESTQGAK
jgi:hypothetical protein